MHPRLQRAAASLALLPLGALLCAPAAASVPNDRYAAIDAYVQERMKATRAPGLSYAVVGPNGPLHQRSWGTDGHGKKITPRTPFLWGSVAKPVTATGVMALVQSGRLRLEEPVTDHLPGFRFGGAAHASKVTVRHLLEQTAGIPASATAEVTDCVDADCPRPAERAKALNNVKPTGPPGTRYAYSSANYLLLAAVVEAVTGRPFADHLRRTVLGPAGMDGAIADAASAKRRDLPPGHQLLWGFPAAIVDGVDDHGAAYGYLGGDLGDLAAFASLQLREGKTAGGEAVLTPDSVRLMRQEGRLRPSGAGTGYGLGWRVGGLDAPLDGAVWHTGATPGYSAMLFLLPKRNIALVLQQNLHGLLHDGAVMQVGFGAARLLAGGRPGEAPSASGYHLAVWSTTGLAVALLVAAGRSVVLLRRRPRSASPLRRAAAAAPWVLVGALPVVALALAVLEMGLRPLTTWAPDSFTALCVAAAAGKATVVLRAVLARRATGPE
ncbi:serine hydrolase domain-containing protein [Spirillospora sp. CA-253888]